MDFSHRSYQLNSTSDVQPPFKLTFDCKFDADIDPKFRFIGYYEALQNRLTLENLMQIPHFPDWFSTENIVFDIELPNLQMFGIKLIRTTSKNVQLECQHAISQSEKKEFLEFVTAEVQILEFKTILTLSQSNVC